MHSWSRIALFGLLLAAPALAADNDLDALLNSGPVATDIPLPEKMEYVFCSIDDKAEEAKYLRWYESF